MEFQLSETNILSSATNAFVTGSEKTNSLLGIDHGYFSYDKAISGKENFPSERRQLLVEELLNTYRKIESKDSVNPKVLENIENLAQRNTFTVCTGQQLHLFLGPAFVLYKILAVIKSCERLKHSYPDKNFIPTYWLASEDHDFEEIKNTRLFNKSYEWKENSGGPCGRLKTDNVKDLIIEIRSSIQLNENQSKLLDDFDRIYSSAADLSEASLRIVNLIFGEYGLVCIDGDNAKLKRSFIPIIKKDILEKRNIETFKTTSLEMEAKGLSTQLHARDINFFHIGPNHRNRIIENDGQYSVMETSISWSKNELESLIDEHPSSFSPNAMMRPLYQEFILPNIEYIGGNAEVNYWLQLHNVMISNGINHPKLSLRPSVWIIPQKSLAWLAKKGIEPVKLLISAKTSEMLHLLNEDKLTIEGEIQNFNRLRQNIQDIIAQNISKELKPLVEAGKAYEKHLRNLEKSLKDSAVEKNKTDLNKLEEIKINYLNTSSIQERTTDSLELLIKYQNVAFTIKNNLPLDAGMGYISSVII